MAQTFFPDVDSKVLASCPPHPENTYIMKNLI